MLHVAVVAEGWQARLTVPAKPSRLEVKNSCLLLFIPIQFSQEEKRSCSPAHVLACFQPPRLLG